MKHAVQSLATGNSGGLWLMYAKLHLTKCPQCREAYEALQSYMEEVKNSPSPSSDLPNSFWKSVESGLDEIDHEERAKKSG